MGLREPYEADAEGFEACPADDDRARLRSGVDEFHRRMDSRSLRFLGEPVEGEDRVRVAWEIVFTKAGAPNLRPAG